jgi:thymidylate synthase ThyX
MAFEAKVVADSISEASDRLTTMEVTFPRMVLSEFNTHRVFSRNSASSRAIPIEKQLERIKSEPFVPTYWGANQQGMQAKAELSGLERERAIGIWTEARNSAVAHAERLLQLGVHKQLTNRLLEPFMWHTVIVTATEWSNFWALRANPDAQPEIRTIAEMMQDAYQTSTPSLVRRDEWHLPLIQPDEYDGTFEFSEVARKVSAARCARVSYLTHDGKRDHEQDLKLYKRLVDGGHMSPLEHVATPDYEMRLEPPFPDELSGKWSGNFRGWKQLRKFIPNEHDFSKVEKEGVA